MSIGPFTHHWSSTGIAWDLYMVINIFAYFGWHNNKLVAFHTLDSQFILTFDDPPFLIETKKGENVSIYIFWSVGVFNRLMEQDLFQRLKKVLDQLKEAAYQT